MLTVSVFDFRNKMADYLKLVGEGEEESLVISRFGKPWVSVKPYGADAGDLKRFYGFMRRKGDKEDGPAYVKRLRRNKMELVRIKRLREGRSDYRTFGH